MENIPGILLVIPLYFARKVDFGIGNIPDILLVIPLYFARGVGFNKENTRLNFSINYFAREVYFGIENM